MRDRPPLTVRLLGHPEVFAGGQPLSFRTRKVLALLIYLVVEGGMHSRESLMALLWPESPPDKAAVTLRGTLSRLRKALQPVGEVLVSQAGTVGVVAEGHTDLDLSWLSSADRPDSDPTDLAVLLDLDRGEFLAGFSLPDAPEFDTWAAVQREACQRQVEAVYDRLSQFQLADHDPVSAVETAARWTARAPLSEVAYRRLMAALALAGDRSSALKTFDQLRAVLQKEFGIEPARETAVLADHIRRDRVQEESRDQGAGEELGPVLPSRPIGLSLPLVGRSAEHNRMVAAYRQLNAQGAQVVTVIGAAGVGKTRLVTAFQDWVQLDSPGVEVWSGRSFETGGRLPYQPVIEAMRVRLERENAPEDLLEDVWLAELSQLMPELRARYPDLPPPMTGDANFVRARLFEAIAALGSALAARHPAVFVLDDLQWADTDTRDMVHYLARRWATSGSPILLMNVVRQESFAADNALRDWLTGLDRDLPATRLLLDPLSGTAVQELVGRLAGPEADEVTTNAFGDWMWAETRGLPFFMEALLQMLVEQGLVTTIGTDDRPVFDFGDALEHIQSVSRLPLPPGVREVILARLERLPEPAAALLLAGAVLGRECSFERLCQVADIAEPEALPALEALLNGYLLSERSASRRPYTLAHDYIRQVVYAESREARRRVFHRRALLALETDRAPAAECAYHALASLLDEPAFRFSLAAGDEAFATYAMMECLAHYDNAQQAARRMLETGTAVPAPSLLQLYQKRGQALELLQDHEAARDHYQEMRALAAEREDRALELAALTAQCMIHATYTSVFNPPLAIELGEAALELSRKLEVRAAEAGSLWGLMLAELFSAGDSQKTMAYGQQSLALARELGLTEQTGYVLTNLCWPYIAQKQLEEARRALQEAQAIWREMGNLPMLAEAGSMRLFVHFFANEHDEVLAAAAELQDLSHSIGSRLNEGNALRFMAGVHMAQGRFGEALNQVEASVALSEETGHLYSAQTDDRFLTALYRSAGALDQAEARADRLLAMRETIMPTFQTYFLSDIARTKIAAGKPSEAQALLDQMLEDFPWEAPWSHTVIPISIARGQLQMARGKPQAVFGDLDEKVGAFREAGFLYELAEELLLRGRAWLAMGDLENAREALTQAQATAEERGERAVLWQILAALSDLEGKSGQMAEAEELRGRAQEVIHEIAEQAGPDELRDAFLAQPAVARVLAGEFS